MTAKRAAVSTMGARLLLAMIVTSAALPVSAQQEATAIRAELDRVRTEIESAETALRAAVAEARAINSETPLDKREEIARRILSLRERLKALASTLAAEQQKIATLSEVDWYVVTAEGTGLSLTAPIGTVRAWDVERKSGREDWVVRAPRASLDAVVAAIRKDIEGPLCDPYGSQPYRTSSRVQLTMALPHFWEQLRVSAGSPLPTQQAAEALRREKAWPVVETQRNVEVGPLLKKFGCPADAITLPTGQREVLNPGGTITVADVRGLPAADADQKLRGAGLAPQMVGGSVPRTPAEQFTVEKTEPLGGAAVAPGSTVHVFVRSKYVEPSRPVPSVVGLPAAVASERLKAAGFVPQMVGGDPPPSREREYTVQDQRPAGPSAPAGSTVVVRIHAQYQAPRLAVPSVAGLPAAQAKQSLEAAGFAVEVAGGDPAPSTSAQFTVQAQQPQAGAPLEAGARVQVRIYSAFVATAHSPPTTPGPPPPRQDVPPVSGDTGPLVPCPDIPPYEGRPSRGLYPEQRQVASRPIREAPSRTRAWDLTGWFEASCVYGPQPDGTPLVITFFFKPPRASRDYCIAPSAILGSGSGTHTSYNSQCFAHDNWKMRPDAIYKYGTYDSTHYAIHIALNTALPKFCRQMQQCSPLPPPVIPLTRQSTRPPCDCVDASGRAYGMPFGQACDPGSPLMRYDCQ